MGALRDRMIEEMKLRNFSAATQKTYVYAVTRLAKYYGKADAWSGPSPQQRNFTKHSCD